MKHLKFIMKNEEWCMMDVSNLNINSKTCRLNNVKVKQ